MDILSDILLRANLKGALYFRTNLSSPWGVEVPPFANVARFHYAHRGRCFVRVEGQEAIATLEQGDLLIVPRGRSHRLFCDPVQEPDVLPLDRVLEISGFTGEGAMVFGGAPSDSDTQLICGHFAFDAMARHPILDRLPPFLLVKDYGRSSGPWLETTLQMIGEEAHGGQIGGEMIVLRMSEIIFAQTLRAFVASAGAEAAGLKGFADPQLLRAMSAMHRSPAQAWTVADLAREAGMSRTGFAQRFSSDIAMSPMSYLANWRMQVARHELGNSRQSVASVAERVGYASEAAFARAFKKATGVTPAAFRKAL